MSDQRSPSYLSDSYRKKLRYNLFSAISSNLRSNITVALGNLDIISEGNSVQYIDESIHDVKNSLNNLQLLAQQMDNLAEMNTPDFVNKNVDLIKILNIIVENLKSLAAQKNIELVFLSEVDRFVAICSPLMLDRLFGHILSILIRSSKPSTSVTLLVSELSKDNLDIKILFTPIFDISPNDININQYHLLLSQPGNIIDSIIIDTISETYGYSSAVVADGEHYLYKVELPIVSNQLQEDEFLDEFNLWSTFVIAESFGLPKEFESDPTQNPADAEIILIIEDNHEVGRFLKKTFEKEFNIIEASNGFEGLRKAVSYIPDLILSDIHMPGVNGIELTKIIKNDDKTSHIPVILLTADTFEANRIKAIESGADEILIKPVSMKELRVRVSALIENREKLRKSLESGLNNKLALENVTDRFLLKLNSLLTDNFHREDFSVENLSDIIGMSPRQLQRKIRAVAGKSPNNFIRSFRLIKAKQMIISQKMSVSEAAYASGFNNLSYFAKCYKEEFGESPSMRNEPENQQ
ncbi:MAG: response regulator [Ignavibacteriaceae bacterium]|jgi:DNA-binding response OmpR family regulator|nr:response regulator [Ignavibacteriaceae bacterium]